MDIQKIKSHMKNNKITYAQLAEMTGLSVSAVTKILGGFAKYPRVDTIEKIEAALGLKNEFNIFDIQGIEQIPTFDEIPLVGTIACGTPILAEENIEDFVKKEPSIKADFALRCKGDSMINARIFDGDIVYIRKQPDVENGEIAAVLIAEDATLKRVYKYANRIELRAENPMYPPINFEGDSLKEITILGKAIAFISIIH